MRASTKSKQTLGGRTIQNNQEACKRSQDTKKEDSYTSRDRKESPTSIKIMGTEPILEGWLECYKQHEKIKEMSFIYIFIIRRLWWNQTVQDVVKITSKAFERFLKNQYFDFRGGRPTFEPRMTCFLSPFT